MLYDLSGLLPFIAVLLVVAGIGALASLAVLTEATVRHHHARVASHQSIPTYYRRLVLAH